IVTDASIRGAFRTRYRITQGSGPAPDLSAFRYARLLPLTITGPPAAARPRAFPSDSAALHVKRELFDESHLHPDLEPVERPGGRGFGARAGQGQGQGRAPAAGGGGHRGARRIGRRA